MSIFMGRRHGRERGKEEGGQKEGESERASSATKSGFITKAAGHCRFMAAAAAADVCPLLPCTAPAPVRVVYPAASRSIARSPARSRCGLSFLFHVSICARSVSSVGGGAARANITDCSHSPLSAPLRSPPENDSDRKTPSLILPS